MKNTVKTIALSLTIISMFNVTSCFKDFDNNSETRTAEMEIDELNKALSSIEAEGHDIDTSDLGIYYIVKVQGEGPLAQIGDTLRLEYLGYLFDGTIFDASAYHYSDSIWEFIFTEHQLISGFEDGISLMNKGAEIEMIIPSEYAYGASGSGPIGPYTTLLFATKMHDINPISE